LEKKLSQERNKESKKLSELTSVRRSIAKKKTSSGIKTAENRANRIEGELAKIKKTRADLEGKVASKTKELHRNEQYLFREQTKEDKSRRTDEIRHEKALTREVRARRHLQEMRKTLSEEFPDYEHQEDEIDEVSYDIFISHASQDKNDFVAPLAAALRERGLQVWYDDFVLKLGDSLRESIDKGISNSKYGLVVLSPHFFAKSWTNRELNGLTTQEVADRRKLILPLWHGVDAEDVREYSPVLADKVALQTKNIEIEEVAEAIMEVLPGVRSQEEEDALDAEEARRILSDTTEIRIPWEQLRSETEEQSS
jgi:hypothetical protein